jgi:uncharacterized protein YbaR (Trm112 family)
MKYRLLDLLRCTCGGDIFDVNTEKIQVKSHNLKFETVRCEKHCGYKKIDVASNSVTATDCSACYDQEVMEGSLACSCGKQHNIIGGIPRFLPESMADNFKKIQATFSHEWKMFRFGERNWGQDIEYRKKLFLQGMGVEKSDLSGKLILDAGCGSGLLSMEMAKSFGMEVVALDLSFGIEKAYQFNKNPMVHFIQGSVLELPLKKSFNYVYCAGVLVALPNTY